MDLVGRVATGCGRASISQRQGNPMVPKWRKQAGFIFVPGTLNVVLGSWAHLTIPCKGTVSHLSWPKDKVPVLIVRERSSNEGPLIELLAPVVLREKFNLVDGDWVMVHV